MYLHFKCYPLFQFLLSHPPFPCFYEDAPPHTHPPLLQHPGTPLHWGKGPSKDRGLLLLMSNNDILCYICGWSWVPPCILFGWWFGLWKLWGVWLADIVLPGVANYFSSFSPFSNSSIEIPVLSPMISYK